MNKECVVGTSGNSDEAVMEVGAMSSNIQLPYSDLYTCQTTPVGAMLRRSVIPTPYDPMDCSPPDFSVHRDSLGNNTGMGCHALLQGIFPTQGLKPGLHHHTFTSCLSQTELNRVPLLGSKNCEMQRLKDSWGKFFRVKVLLLEWRMGLDLEASWIHLSPSHSEQLQLYKWPQYY